MKGKNSPTSRTPSLVKGFFLHVSSDGLTCSHQSELKSGSNPICAHLSLNLDLFWKTMRGVLGKTGVGGVTDLLHEPTATLLLHYCRHIHRFGDTFTGAVNLCQPAHGFSTLGAFERLTNVAGQQNTFSRQGPKVAGTLRSC